MFTGTSNVHSNPTYANLHVNQRFIHTCPSCGFTCYHVYLRGSTVVKFPDSKVTINCLVLIMTISNIQRYLGKLLSLKDSSSGRRSFQYHNYLSIYYFEVNIAIQQCLSESFYFKVLWWFYSIKPMDFLK